MDTYKAINDILVHLFNEIWELEEKAIITEEYKDITNNDMHIIEAIGLGEGNNMSTIAKKLNITVGSLTTSMTVSYTHLDVYKRQNLCRAWRIWSDWGCLSYHFSDSGWKRRSKGYASGNGRSRCDTGTGGLYQCTWHQYPSQ